MAMTMAPLTWHPPTRTYLSAAPTPLETPLPQKNEVEMTREMLIKVLTYFSTLIPQYFGGRPVRLVVHGGACMLLHPKLNGLTQIPSMAHSLFVDEHGRPVPVPARRTATRDVDFIARAFIVEWQKAGVPDALDRLKSCIRATARKFGLGADWMNSDADVALPMANDTRTNTVYDPVYTDSLRPNNIHLHTVFTSPNQMLTLISVTPFWAVALKLVRYVKWDPGDICALLRNGTIESKVRWTAEILEGWLHKQCWSMGYASYDTTKMMEMRRRIQHAVMMVNAWNQVDPVVAPSAPSMTSSTSSLHSQPTGGSSSSAPEAWSMGGWGQSSAHQPPNVPWTSQHSTDAHPSAPVATSATTNPHPPAASFIGGFALLQPRNGHPAPPSQSGAHTNGDQAVHPLDLARQFPRDDEPQRKTLRLRQPTMTSFDRQSWSSQSNDSAPVIPDFDRLSLGDSRHSRKKSKTLPTHPIFIPPDDVPGAAQATTRWEWHGLTETEKERFTAERHERWSVELNEDGWWVPSIPRTESPSHLHRPQRYQADSSNQMDTPRPQLPADAYSGMNAWDRHLTERSNSLPSSNEEEARLWHPYHDGHRSDGRDSRSSNLRVTQSLGVF